MIPGALLLGGAIALIAYALMSERKGDEKSSENGNRRSDSGGSSKSSGGNRQRDGTGGVTDDGMVNQGVGGAHRSRAGGNRDNQPNPGRTDGPAEPVTEAVDVQLEEPASDGGRDGGNNAPA